MVGRRLQLPRNHLGPSRISRRMASMPSAGPSAISASVSGQPRAAAAKGTACTVKKVRVKPSAVWKVEQAAHPFGGRRVGDQRRELGGIGHDGCAPGQHQQHHQPDRATEGERGGEAGRCTRRHRPFRHPRLAHPVGGAARGHAEDAAQRDGGKGEKPRRLRRALAERGGEGGGGRRTDPGPEGVELPHVAQIARVGEPQPPVAPGQPQRPRIEPRRAGVVRPEPRAEAREPAERRQRRGGHHGGAPVRASHPGKEVRQRRAEGDRADDQPHQQAAVAGSPTDGDLHRHRVDPRHAGAGEPAECNLRGPADRNGEECQVRRRPDHGRGDQHRARIEPVGGAVDGERQRADHEADLHGARQRRCPTRSKARPRRRFRAGSPRRRTRG